MYKRRWLKSTCWAVGNGGNYFDDHLKGNENGSLLGALDESFPAPFETLDAEITPETIDFFVSDAEGDPDCPSPNYSSIEEALNALRQGKVENYRSYSKFLVLHLSQRDSFFVFVFLEELCSLFEFFLKLEVINHNLFLGFCYQFVIVVDDENGDIEGNIVTAASLTSPRDIAFMIKLGSGIVSVGMKVEDLDRLNLPLMSPDTENEDSSAPTFTITVVIFCICQIANKTQLVHSDIYKVQVYFKLCCVNRMQSSARQPEYQLQTGPRLFLLLHLLSLSQKTSGGQAMYFPSSIEMVGF